MLQERLKDEVRARPPHSFVSSAVPRHAVSRRVPLRTRPSIQHPAPHNLTLHAHGSSPAITNSKVEICGRVRMGRDRPAGSRCGRRLRESRDSPEIRRRIAGDLSEIRRRVQRLAAGTRYECTDSVPWLATPRCWRFPSVPRRRWTLCRWLPGPQAVLMAVATSVEL